MRPLRFILTISTCILAFFFLLFIGPWRSDSPEDSNLPADRRLGAYFNWRTPSSLFPPSAIISLTDDNSTFFLARPAAFGPLLPAKSLSSQLWVGSGFGDDHLGRSGEAGGEGELGCSDVPGWDGGDYSSPAGMGRKVVSHAKVGKVEGKEKEKQKRSSKDGDDEEDDEEKGKHPDKDDGTDDHLHHPLPASEAVKQNGEVAGTSKKPTHADIQSLQEGAEIAGKIVLLSRGGCGFLEKVKWVQRRGGVALIVGDNIRGGPLVTMYARGDTSNITIPALFTSHTTAHLMSSLIPSGGILDDLLPEEAARLGLALGEKAGKAGGKKVDEVEKPNFTSTTATIKATSTPKAQKQKEHKQGSLLREDEELEQEQEEEAGWFWSIFGRGAAGGRREDSSRPPSSGNIDWVLQREFDEEEPLTSTSTTVAKHAPTRQPGGSSDGFRIGVQDWRDPDLVAEQKEQQQKEATGSTSTSTSQAPSQSSKAVDSDGLRGGSITPGSGEYSKSAHQAVDVGNVQDVDEKDSTKAKDSAGQQNGKSQGWFSGLFFSKTETVASEVPHYPIDPIARPHQPATHASKQETTSQPAAEKALPEHTGLWITLTPTSMSSSPFFDTLLVLVVSPLVTLTVVYALLLLRSRIRRRRWRAPKSVVERLPVRTYQTIAPSSGAPSSTTSSVSHVSATTPLLPSSGSPRAIQPRPRSRTASDVPATQAAAGGSSSLDQVEEKRVAGLAEWRRRYGGKQRECVVCLEEYVDGVSRVMSLPCGHEFHEGCITPWLTTRRRTCPICKNDIVRSLARNSSPSGSSPPANQQGLYRHDEDEDDIQEQAALLANEDPSSREPVVSREVEAFEDLEAGVSDEERRNR